MRRCAADVEMLCLYCGCVVCGCVCLVFVFAGFTCTFTSEKRLELFELTSMYVLLLLSENSLLLLLRPSDESLTHTLGVLWWCEHTVVSNMMRALQRTSNPSKNMIFLSSSLWVQVSPPSVRISPNIHVWRKDTWSSLFEQVPSNRKVSRRIMVGKYIWKSVYWVYSAPPQIRDCQINNMRLSF